MTADFDERIIQQLRDRPRKTKGASVADRLEEEVGEFKRHMGRSTNRRKTGRTELLGVRFTKEDVDFIRREAEERKLLIAEVLEEALDLYCAKHKKRRG